MSAARGRGRRLGEPDAAGRTRRRPGRTVGGRGDAAAAGGRRRAGGSAAGGGRRGRGGRGGGRAAGTVARRARYRRTRRRERGRRSAPERAALDGRRRAGGAGGRAGTGRRSGRGSRGTGGRCRAGRRRRRGGGAGAGAPGRRGAGSAAGGRRAAGDGGRAGGRRGEAAGGGGRRHGSTAGRGRRRGRRAGRRRPGRRTGRRDGAPARRAWRRPAPRAVGGAGRRPPGRRRGRARRRAGPAAAGRAAGGAGSGEAGRGRRHRGGGGAGDGDGGGGGRGEGAARGAPAPARPTVSTSRGKRTMRSSRRARSRAYSSRSSVVHPWISARAALTWGWTTSLTSSGRRAAMAARSWGRTASATTSVSRSWRRVSMPLSDTSPTCWATASLTTTASRSPSECSIDCRRAASLRRAAAQPSSSASDVVSSATRFPPSSVSMARCWATLVARAWTWRRSASNSSRIHTSTWPPASRGRAAPARGSVSLTGDDPIRVILPDGCRPVQEPFTTPVTGHRRRSAASGSPGAVRGRPGGTVDPDGPRSRARAADPAGHAARRRSSRCPGSAPPWAWSRGRSGSSGTTSPASAAAATRPASSSTCAPTPSPRGCDVLVTGGGQQSNHVRMTAAAANRLGLDCVVVVPGAPPGDGHRQRPARRAVRPRDRPDRHGRDGPDRRPRLLRRRGGHRRHHRPAGGRGPASLRDPDRRGQRGGRPRLRAGRRRAARPGGRRHGRRARRDRGGRRVGRHPRRPGRRARRPRPRPRRRRGRPPRPRRRPAGQDGRGGGPGRPARAGRRRRSVDHDQVGRGYADLTDACREALLLAARTEGLLLDPVYTGKAMAGLIAARADGRIGPATRTVFLHTGGMPALFAAGVGEWLRRAPRPADTASPRPRPDRSH